MVWQQGKGLHALRIGRFARRFTTVWVGLRGGDNIFICVGITVTIIRGEILLTGFAMVGAGP